MSARHEAPRQRSVGDVLVRVGAVLFAVGVVGVLAILVPFFTGRRDAPASLDLVALLLPFGLGTALVGLLLGARHAE